MYDMKRLIGITGVFLIAFTVASASLAPAGESVLAASADTAATDGTALFTAKEEDGRIAIYAGQLRVRQTQTRVDSLPKIDRMRLREGIDFNSEEELKQFIEDYCS